MNEYPAVAGGTTPDTQFVGWWPRRDQYHGSEYEGRYGFMVRHQETPVTGHFIITVVDPLSMVSANKRVHGSVGSSVVRRDAELRTLEDLLINYLDVMRSAHAKAICQQIIDVRIADGPHAGETMRMRCWPSGQPASRVRLIFRSDGGKPGFTRTPRAAYAPAELPGLDGVWPYLWQGNEDL